MATKKYSDMTVGLTEADRLRLADIAKREGKTKSEAARAAIRWYLDHYEQIQGQSTEGEYAQSLSKASDQLLAGEGLEDTNQKEQRKKAEKKRKTRGTTHSFRPLGNAVDSCLDFRMVIPLACAHG